jgi:putative flavoprotein involved in K+ transport
VLAGRLRGVRDGRVVIVDNPAASLAKADQFAAGVRTMIDESAGRAELGQNQDDPWPSYRRPGRTAAHVEGEVDLAKAGIRSVVWACGYRPDFSWIRAHIFDEHGFPRHTRGISQVPGLYFVGLPWLHKWKSATLLDGGEDAAFIAEHVTSSDHRAADTRRPVSTTSH